MLCLVITCCFVKVETFSLLNMCRGSNFLNLYEDSDAVHVKGDQNNGTKSWKHIVRIKASLSYNRTQHPLESLRMHHV